MYVNGFGMTCLLIADPHLYLYLMTEEKWLCELAVGYLQAR